MAVPVNGVTAPETDEIFSIKLSSPTNAAISDDTSTGTIDEDDNRAPTVVRSSLTPPNGKTGEQRSTNVTARFSEVMDEQTVTTSTVKLSKVNSTTGTTTLVGDGTTVSCVNDRCQTIKLDPFGTSTILLVKNTTYRVVITNGVKDAAGNALAREFSWGFRTGLI